VTRITISGIGGTAFEGGIEPWASLQVPARRQPRGRETSPAERRAGWHERT